MAVWPCSAGRKIRAERSSSLAEQFARQVSQFMSPGCPSQGSWLLWHCLAPWSPCLLSEGVAWGRRFGGFARPAG